jgi:hypothetical protein
LTIGSTQRSRATRAYRFEDLGDARQLETVRRGQGTGGKKEAGGHQRRALELKLAA